MKQIMQVYAAVTEQYAETAHEVADVTGMPVAWCSTYLGRLARLGLIRDTGRTSPTRRADGRGRRMRHYEPVSGGAA